MAVAGRVKFASSARVASPGRVAPADKLLEPSTLWSEICAEFAASEPLHPDDLEQKEENIDEEKNDPVPIFQVPWNVGAFPAVYEAQDKPAPASETPSQKSPSELPLPLSPEPPDLKTCPPTEFLEYYVFPVLLPGIEQLLLEAKKYQCFERKRTKFIALDFLTEWLFNHSTKTEDSDFVPFFEIPFVKDWLRDHPRPPIARCLLMTDAEASNIIQSFWRGYQVRRIPDVQELRQWQKHFRETRLIFKRVQEFWAMQEKRLGIKLEDSARPSLQHSKLSVPETFNEKDTDVAPQDEKTSV